MSANNTTLDEIQSLRIINDALEKEKRSPSSNSDAIDESLIEDKMVDRIKKSGASKNPYKIQQLV